MIAKILFGSDLDLEKTYPFRRKDGSIEQVNFQDLFIRNVKEGMEEGMRLVNLVLPFLVRNNIGAENRRIAENNHTLQKATREFLA